jgi:hypothetical protein
MPDWDPPTRRVRIIVYVLIAINLIAAALLVIKLEGLHGG